MLVPSLVLALAPCVSASVAAAPIAAQEAAPAGVRWMASYEEAQRVAAKEGKHLFVDFTGTGWCSWCKRLDDEVLTRPEFAARVADEFVFVRLDFDADGVARKDLPFAQANDELKERLGVEAFPTVVLTTADGRPYASLGYEPGGAAPFAERAAAEVARARELERAVPGVLRSVTAAKSADEAREAADAAAVLLREARTHSLARPLVPIVRSILSGENIPREREMVAVHALSLAEDVDPKLVDRAFRLDPRNENGLPEAALAATFNTLESPDGVEELIERAEGLLRAGPVHDAELAAHLYGHCAYWSRHWLNDADRSKIHARFALGLEPKDDRLRTMLEGLSGG